MSTDDKDFYQHILESANWDTPLKPGETKEDEVLEEGLYTDEEGHVYYVSDEQEITELSEEEVQALETGDEADEQPEAEDDEGVEYGFFEDEDGELFYVSESRKYYAVLEDDDEDVYFVDEDKNIFEAWEQEDENGEVSIVLEETDQTLS